MTHGVRTAWAVQDIGDELLGRSNEAAVWVDADVAQEVADYLNADDTICGASMFWLSEGQPVVFAWGHDDHCGRA